MINWDEAFNCGRHSVSHMLEATPGVRESVSSEPSAAIRAIHCANPPH